LDCYGKTHNKVVELVAITCYRIIKNTHTHEDIHTHTDTL